MATPISQNEIDALLGGIETLDDTSLSETDADTDEKPPHKTGVKYVGILAEQPYRFKSRYRSPILKGGEYIYNPEPDAELDESIPVVRSISEYAQYCENKK